MVTPIGKVLGALLVVLATPQLSDVEGLPNTTDPEEQAVTSAGQVIIGGSLSCMVTDWLQVAVLPELSVMLQVTMVVPIGKDEGALLVILKPGQLSSPEADPIFTVLLKQTPGLVPVVTDPGQLITGLS